MSGGDQPSRSERDASDANAMRRIRDGDDAALAELYDRYAPLAFSMALKIVRDEGAAEDIVHDAFIAIVERADQYRVERGSVAAWLITAVRNLALDYTRRHTRRAEITENDLQHEPVEPVPDPEQLSWLERERTSVRAALATLSPAQRATLETAFFEGLSYPEIAEREGVPLGTVKSRAARALAALREALDAEEEARDDEKQGGSSAG